MMHASWHLLTISVALVMGMLSGASVSMAQLISGGFDYDGRSRQYLLFLPSVTQPAMPLVLVLHGYLQTAADIRDYSEMHAVADTGGFIVVYPDAVPPGFNAGLINYPDFPPLALDVDDVGFISALIDTVTARYPVDRDRIYCCGLSLGGEMTYRLLGERGSRFAAVASVTGKLNSVSAAAYQAPTRAVPILHIHGTRDPIERYYEGPANLYTVPQTLDFLIAEKGCTGPPDTVALPDTDLSDSSTVQRITWDNCDGDAPLIFYRIEGGGHAWPGGCCNYNWAHPTNRDFSASEEIWRFFLQWENPLSTMAFGQWLELAQSYANPAGDSVGMRCQLYNPDGHAVTVRATLEGGTTSYRDSITMVDDGQHGDGEAGDNVFGAVVAVSGLQEEVFTVSLNVRDEFFALSQRLNTTPRFTTEGPLVQATTMDFPMVDAGYVPELRWHEFYLVLENLGSTATVENVTAFVSSTDDRFDILDGSANFSNAFTPGMIDTSYTTVLIQYRDGYGPESLSGATFSVEVSGNGYAFWQDTIKVVTAVKEEEEGFVPTSYALGQNYPNPFNPTTTMEYVVPQTCEVTLVVYNMLGERVALLVSGRKTAGRYRVSWDASQLPSGVYVCRMTAGGFSLSRKAIVLK